MTTPRPSGPSGKREMPLKPGDEAIPGTPGTGEDICLDCEGSGKLEDGRECPTCEGTGRVVRGIGGG